MENAGDTKARAMFARAAALFPDDPSLSLFHARSLAAAEQYDEAAIAVYEKAWVDSKKSDLALLAALGRAYILSGTAEGKNGKAPRRMQAITVWENLYRQGAGWPELTQALAQAYTYDDRVSDVALQVWGQVVADEPKNGKLRARLGREWRARGDGDEALRGYREAATLLPRDCETQFAAGTLVRERTGDLAGAEKLLAKATRLCPKHLEAHFALGETLLAQDKKDAAKEVFLNIVNTIDAAHAPTLLHLGKLNLRYEDSSVQAAEALFEQARTLDPDRAETHKKLADLYREKGQTEDEQRALETYLKLSSPGDADAHRQLADLYIRRGDYQKAETALRQVIALGQGDKKTYTLLGEVMVQARARAA
jgi:tetratricopeptide (TPR) repeat protein